MNKIEVEKAVETHADTIWRLAWIHCNRVQENAEDVFQETFLSMADPGSLKPMQKEILS